jgi:hypothetical protein
MNIDEYLYGQGMRHVGNKGRHSFGDKLFDCQNESGTVINCGLPPSRVQARNSRGLVTSLQFSRHSFLNVLLLRVRVDTFLITSKQLQLFSTLLSLDITDMTMTTCAGTAAVAHCPAAAPVSCSSSELWITYHQTSCMHRQVTAQLFDLEDILDHIFQQGFVDPKWRSVAWWEECTSVRHKASHAVQELAARARRRKHPRVRSSSRHR